MKNDKIKEWLDRIKVFAEIILIICTIFFGNMLTSNFKDKEIKLQTLKVALEILRNNPEKDDPLREWALDVFEKYADPKPSKEVKEILRKKSLNKYLIDQDGNYITDEDGNKLIVE
jgi:hypothetical protein